MTELEEGSDGVPSRVPSKDERVAYRVLGVLAVLVFLMFVAVGIARHVSDAAAYLDWITFIGTSLAGVGAIWGLARSIRKCDPVPDVIIWLLQVLGFWGAAMYAVP